MGKKILIAAGCIVLFAGLLVGAYFFGRSNGQQDYQGLAKRVDQLGESIAVQNSRVAAKLGSVESKLDQLGKQISGLDGDLSGIKSGLSGAIGASKDADELVRRLSDSLKGLAGSLPETTN